LSCVGGWGLLLELSLLDGHSWLGFSPDMRISFRLTVCRYQSTEVVYDKPYFSRSKSGRIERQYVCTSIGPHILRRFFSACLLCYLDVVWLFELVSILNILRFSAHVIRVPG
jgi:hypothetical protein